MIRVAAVGDLHVGLDSAGLIAPGLAGIEESADLLLLAGDLTTHGSAEQARVLTREVADVPIPIVAVLGNHDYHAGQQASVSRQLEDGGVVVLESASHVSDVAGTTVAIVGSKGFGGGFVGASLAPFGEDEMKAFARTSIEMASAFERLLSEVDADLRIGLLHYAPIRETLLGEPPEIFPFLGSYLFAEAVDRAGADLVVHGHAHRGTEWGETPGGIPVRNVAKAVLRQAYRVYTLQPGDVSARRHVGAMGRDAAR